MVRGFAKLLVLFIFAMTVSTAIAAQEIRRVSIGDTALAYVEAGKGEPVVFVHGGLQDYRFRNVLLPRFAERYRVIAYSCNHFPNPMAEDGAPDGAADIHGEDLAALIAIRNKQRLGRRTGADLPPGLPPVSDATPLPPFRRRAGLPFPAETMARD